ncbi:hypothetical protein LOD99_14524 [Oopsacas minuta]|uniref:C2 NT-type domain-containing protein n=1 Tax=Oopsacas minuta TaxID=111878 RepID=A0AAV7KDV4_9METZ|nr:hypothetical protein LOD99_14524 [Oopsacas minuta]
MFKNSIRRKKKFNFQVKLTIEELLSIPFLSSLIYVKVKLLSSLSAFSYQTKKYEVSNHTVRIYEHLSFDSKTLAKSDGVIQPLLLHISIRREMMGGKSYEKLGYVNIDLTQYAGSGISSQHYLLQNSHSRSINSILKVRIFLQQISGDPCYKVCVPKPLPVPRTIEDNSVISWDIFSPTSITDSSQPFQLNNTYNSIIPEHQTNLNSGIQSADEPTLSSKDSNISTFPIKIQYPIIHSEFDTIPIRTKRLSTIDHPSERVYLSRISAENVVEQIFSRETPQYMTCSPQYVSKCLLNLDKTGTLTLISTKNESILS